MDKILGIRSAKEIAEIPKSYEDVMEDVDLEDVYKMLYKYYSQDGLSLSPDVYGIKEEDGEEKISYTTLARPDDENLEYSGIESGGLRHSHYSKQVLEDIGISLEDSWNGNAIGIRHKDDKLEIIDTDYYSSSAYSRLLFLEAANALDRAESTSEAFDMMPFREKHLSNLEDFYRPDWLSREGTIGGLVIAYNGSTWKIILGKRSSEPRVNPELVSVAPNGGMGYKAIQEGGIKGSLKSHFHEEFFKGKYQPRFFEDYVQSHQVLNGWNLRDSSFVIGNLLIVSDPEGYEKLINRKTHNFEFDSLVTIDVQDSERIADIANMSEMSPSTIPYVYKGLAVFEELENTPDLEYDILEKN